MKPSLRYVYLVHYNLVRCRDLWSWQADFTNVNGATTIKGVYWYDTLDQAATELQSEYLSLVQHNGAIDLGLKSNYSTLRI